MTIFDSCVMRLQTIGEYVKKIDDKTNKQLLPKYPQVPWVKVIGQRNIISHEYSAANVADGKPPGRVKLLLKYYGGVIPGYPNPFLYLL